MPRAHQKNSQSTRARLPAADLEPRVRALCDFAVKLTGEPPGRSAARTSRRFGALGWSDPAIHDAIQVISYFNYVNRIADAVGIEDEPEWDAE